MTTFRRLALLSTIGTYVVIFAGGLVRVSGAGLGCPDWPKCFGGWIPPISAIDLPAGIDPATFNFTLAWIEYLNRFSGMILGLFIAATAVLALMRYRAVRSILYPSLGAALLVAFQGWQGGQVVISELQPLAVSIHLVVALVIVSLLTYVSQKAYYLEEASDRPAIAYPKAVPLSIAILWVLTVIQIIIGANVRAGIESLITTNPLGNDHELLALAGGIKYAHALLGVVVAALTLVVGVQIYRVTPQPEAIVRMSVWWLIFLVATQMMVGTGLIAVALPPLLQLFHVWIASLFVGALLVLYTATKRV
jgi:cytochrome c oxidase assembly protein subunit 15